MYFPPYIGGLWFGDPNKDSQRVFIPNCGISREQVLDVERRAGTPEKFAIGLLLLLFTPAELQWGNCTKPLRDDIQELDSAKVFGLLDVRKTWLVMYP